MGIKKIFTGIFTLIIIQNVLFASQKANLKEQFKNNEAVIYTINIRSFGAVDKNNDGIIEEEKGDIRGTFLNAKDKLKDLAYEGINTIYVLPITKTGKLKALGTAGSLYAMDSFTILSPELDDKSNNLSIEQEVMSFTEKAHELNMNVIVDLPSCGSYDLSIKKPDWFIYNNTNEAIIPADWTDVRLFKIYNDDNKTLYEPTVKNFKNFVDKMQSLGFDGIRADVAAIKPYAFWKEIISYAKSKNNNFIFIAEATPEWDNPAPNGVKHYTKVPELLSAGFRGYYGSGANFKNIKTKEEFDKRLKNNLSILKKNKNAAIMSSFATHDIQSPILKGENYWNMILWLNATLPINSYFLDGFSTGDDYIYPYENLKAEKSSTDDEYYFVHSGLFDIFNFSRPAKSGGENFKKEYIKAIAFKKEHSSLIKPKNLTVLKTDNSKIFAYKLSNFGKEIIVAGSLDDDNVLTTTLKSKYLNSGSNKSKQGLLYTINAKNKPVIQRNNISIKLEPHELAVYLIQKN